MALFGLIGHPVSHSFSKDFFSNFFRENNLNVHSYELFDLPSIELFSTLMKERNPSGLNVTIPHKTAILPFLDTIDDYAAEIGAVNCISREGAKIKGYNTDAPAFKATLLDMNLPFGTRALVLGNGGAAKAVITILKQLDIPYEIVSRTISDELLHWDQLTRKHIETHHLIINCTPVGMWPKQAERLQLPFESFGSKHFVYDLIYNPAETILLKEARLRGSFTMNGQAMLERQALESWNIWKSQV